MFEINSDFPSSICTCSIWKGADCIPFAAPVQMKELTFSHGIAAHDLTTKVKQIESWLEKNNHIRVTLRARRGQPAHNLVRTLALWKLLIRDRGLLKCRTTKEFHLQLVWCESWKWNDYFFKALICSLQCAKKKNCDMLNGVKQTKQSLKWTFVNIKMWFLFESYCHICLYELSTNWIMKGNHKMSKK